MSPSLLQPLWTDPDFVNQVINRYNSIVIKGYSITRIILGFDNAGAAPPLALIDAQFISLAARIDRNVVYGSQNNGVPYANLVKFQDCYDKSFNLTNYSGDTPPVIEFKVLAGKREQFELDCQVVPGQPGNANYWDIAL